MTYTNDLPSNILSMETSMRLHQLGCAVTAGKETASPAEQKSRGKAAAMSAFTAIGHIPAQAFGKAQRA